LNSTATEWLRQRSDCIEAKAWKKLEKREEKIDDGVLILEKRKFVDVKMKIGKQHFKPWTFVLGLNGGWVIATKERLYRSQSVKEARKERRENRWWSLDFENKKIYWFENEDRKKQL